MSDDKPREVKKGYNPAGIADLRSPPEKAKEGYNPTGIVDARGIGEKPKKTDQK